jgi:Ras homolog gene family, member A
LENPETETITGTSSLQGRIDALRFAFREAANNESLASFVIPIWESGSIFQDNTQAVDNICELVDSLFSFKTALTMQLASFEAATSQRATRSANVGLSTSGPEFESQSSSLAPPTAPPQYAPSLPHVPERKKGKFKPQRLPGSTVTYLEPPPPYSFKEEPVRPEMNLQETPRTVKVVIVGDGACGKTCAMVAHIERTYPEVYVPTVFDNYLLNGITHDAASSSYYTQLHVWDTAGQEDYDRLRPLSYPETDVVVVSFAIDSPDSLDNVQEKWMSEVLHFNQGVPIVLAGLKSDLRDDPRTIQELQKTSQKPVDYEEGARVARQIGATAYMECSAKDMSGLQDMLKVATEFGVSKKYHEAQAGRWRPRRGLFT